MITQSRQDAKRRRDIASPSPWDFKGKALGYIKASVRWMIPGSDLGAFADFQVRYGHGGGYPWAVGLAIDQTCHNC